MSHKFPDGFLWGTATAAYQIEGATERDGRKPSIWDVFSKTPGKIENGDTGEIACNHYALWQEDIELLNTLGAKNYRFSVAWPRILPNGIGEINQKGLDFYNGLIDGLLAKNITPWITMYHWDLPQSLQERGGWLNRDIVEWFGEYADVLIAAFGDRVKNWFIFNEPSCVAYLGHGNGHHAPGLRGRDHYFNAAHNINRVIGATYHRIKASHPYLQIGSAFTLAPGISIDPQDDFPAEMAEAIWNWNYLDPVLGGAYPSICEEGFAPFIKDGDMRQVHADLDFIGVQYYSPNYWKRDKNSIMGADFARAPAGLNLTDIGWPIDPNAFEAVLRAFGRRYPKVPVFISENGACFNTVPVDGRVDDQQRIGYLNEHIAAVQRAIAAGVAVKGYFCWSFLDNFEWAFGYNKRFGLVYVDYLNAQKRIPKESFYWFRDVATHNCINHKDNK